MPLIEISPEIEMHFFFQDEFVFSSTKMPKCRMEIWVRVVCLVSWLVWFLWLFFWGGDRLLGWKSHLKYWILLYNWELPHIHSPVRRKWFSCMRPAAAGSAGRGPQRYLQECCRSGDLCCPMVGDKESVPGPLCWVFGCMTRMAGDTQDIWEGRVILWMSLFSLISWNKRQKRGSLFFPVCKIPFY